MQNKTNFIRFKVSGLLIICIVLSLINSSNSQTWVPQNSQTDRDLNSVFFTSSLRGWSVGNEGTAVFTINSGMNWFSIKISDQDLRGVAFMSPLVGVIVGRNGMIFRTSDGGLMWNMVMSGTNADLNSVAFGDNGIAYTAGNDGVILKSVNSGISWMRVDSALSQSMQTINSVSAKGTMFAAFAGNSGFITITTNGGVSFDTINSGTTRDLRTIFFTSILSGFTAGTNNTMLFSSNGGMNWASRNSGLQIIDDTNEVDINGIFFLNPVSGFAVGNSGSIFRTTNAGINWVREMSQTNEDLNSVFFADENHGWAVGHNGTIRFRGSLTGLRNLGQTAENYRLEQNFPNPFNPSTKIRFSIPSAGFVSLLVYDITGKNISRLVNGNLSPGAYEIEFNASAYPSGIYFYELRTGSFSETRKMILVK